MNCPISEETFAWISFTINDNIEVISAVGKGVSVAEDKSTIIHDSKGRIKLDLVKDNFFIYSEPPEEERLKSRHVESFLEAVLQQKDPMSVPGVLSFDAALGILEVLDKARGRIGNMPRYRIGESIVDGILNRFQE
jgi:predicted dehydrogenase